MNPIEDVVPRRGRPNKATVQRLLATNGQQVTAIFPELVEDNDGQPAGVIAEPTKASLEVSLPLLGWTQHEYDDPNITE